MFAKATGWISFIPILRTTSNKNEGARKKEIEKDKIMATKYK
jgi:hypothetical protein